MSLPYLATALLNDLALHSTLCLLIIPTGLAVWKDDGWNSHLEDWWHYKVGVIGGPDQWGRRAYMACNTWHICHRGRFQSPISIATASLVFDPNLGPLSITGADLPTTLAVTNTGTDVVVSVLGDHRISVTRGPLSYTYSMFGALIKFGSRSDRGSDHRIDSRSFPGELQLYGFNSELHENYSTALTSAHGMVAVAAFMQIEATSSKDMAALVEATRKTVLKGSRTEVSGIKLKNVLPDSLEYVTYEGSLPFPGCHESVTWIILNRPVAVTRAQLSTLRALRISSVETSAFMSDNWRPAQPLNRRTVRTNIRLKSRRLQDDASATTPEAEKCGIVAQQYYYAHWSDFS